MSINSKINAAVKNFKMIARALSFDETDIEEYLDGCEDAFESYAVSYCNGDARLMFEDFLTYFDNRDLKPDETPSTEPEVLEPGYYTESQLNLIDIRKALIEALETDDTPTGPESLVLLAIGILAAAIGKPVA